MLVGQLSWFLLLKALNYHRTEMGKYLTCRKEMTMSVRDKLMDGGNRMLAASSRCC